MSQLEAQLRLSVIRAELAKLVDTLDPKAARIVRYAVSVLGLLEARR
jgi:hypothetical protein